MNTYTLRNNKIVGINLTEQDLANLIFLTDYDTVVKTNTIYQVGDTYTADANKSLECAFTELGYSKHVKDGLGVSYVDPQYRVEYVTAQGMPWQFQSRRPEGLKVYFTNSFGSLPLGVLESEVAYKGELLDTVEWYLKLSKERAEQLGYLQGFPSTYIDYCLANPPSWSEGKLGLSILSGQVNLYGMCNEEDLTGFGVDTTVQLPKPIRPISPRQLGLILSKRGWLSQVELMLESLTGEAKETALIEYNKTSEVYRNSPLVEQIGSGLGLSSSEIDSLFVEASKL